MFQILIILLCSGGVRGGGSKGRGGGWGGGEGGRKKRLSRHLLQEGDISYPDLGWWAGLEAAGDVGGGGWGGAGGGGGVGVTISTFPENIARLLKYS